MKYVKTYEGWFDFLKKKKEPKRDEISAKLQADKITEEIVDSMWDIFDKYEIVDKSQNDEPLYIPSDAKSDSLYWYYNYTKDGVDEGYIKCGIIISGWKNYIGTDIRSLVDDKQSQPLGNEFLNDMNKLIPVINARTGIVLNKPYIMGNKYIIDFPVYISNLRRIRGW